MNMRILLPLLPLLLGAAVAHAGGNGPTDRKVPTAQATGYAREDARPMETASAAPQGELLMFSGKPRETHKRADFSLIHAPATPVMAGLNTWR